MFKITQKISLFALFIYGVICVLLILLFKSIIPGVAGVFVGYCVFVIVLLMQQYLHRRTFRQGIKWLKANQYQLALACFQNNLKHFEQYPFLDRMRYLLLISPSAYSCKEMCLRNITACYVLLKHKEEATFYYQTLIILNSDWKSKMPWYDDFLNENFLPNKNG